MTVQHPIPTAEVLAVDLDGTLLRTDLLYETFWSAVSRDWRSPFAALRALAKGKAALKRHLVAASDVDVTTLPYDATALDHVRKARAEGLRVVLVTAADHGLAEAVAKHLGLFDEVHGSDGTTNLKGPAKAAFLTARYGAGGFAYLGDATADLPVWSAASRAVTINASPSLRRQAEATGPATHIGASQTDPHAYLRALRPHQWMKNLLCFVPLLAAHQFTGATAFASLLAFVAFSLTASSVYCLNDLLDLPADRAHPRKCKRPFASGAIPLRHGTFMAAGLLAGGIVTGLAIDPTFLLVLGAYYGLTTAYSLYIKREVVIDICVLAGLYTMRIVAGACATGIPLSVWLLAFSIFLFFSLAAVKRQAELVDMASRGELEAAGRGYRADDLPIVAMIALGAGFVSVLVMALYLDGDSVQSMYANPAALWGICCVLLFWITRMVMKAHRGQMHDDPLVFAAKDGASRMCLLAMLGFALGGMYLA